MQDIGEMQRIVLVEIEMYGPQSNSQIADRLRKKINSITGRVWELRNMGLVEQAGEILDEITQRMVMTWRAV
jgi:predicted transcriptional regulator